jgi:hypothetical protein
MRTLALLAAGLALALAGAASAQVLGGTALPPPPITANRDLQVFIAPCGRPYRVAMGQPYPVVLWFAEADTDRDGRLTDLELRADALRFFAELDLNKSRLLEPNEVERYQNEVAPEVLGADVAIDDAPARLWQVQQSSGNVWRGPKGNSAGTARTRRLGSYASSTNGTARFMLIPRVNPVASANVDMQIDIRPYDFTAQASRDFETLDQSHKGYLLFADLPPTLVQQRAQRR